MKKIRNTPRRIAVIIAIFLLCSFSQGAEYQRVSFKKFFAGQIAPVDLSFEIPKEYEHAEKLGEDLLVNVYWMRPEEVDGATKTGNLPKKTGFIRGTISMSVGYSKGKFSIEDSFEGEFKKNEMVVISKKRFEADGYPVLAMLVKNKEGEIMSTVYVATKIETNVLSFHYFPAGSDLKLAIEVWSRLISSLKKSV